MKITNITNPLQTILLTCRDQNKDNVITLDWHMPLSFDPMMYAVSIGKTRFSLDLIRKSRVFVVNFMSKDFKKEVIYCGTNCGENLDKFSKSGLEKEEAEKINCPRIKGSLGYLECQVEKEIETGDHVLFIGKVVSYDLREKGKRLFHLGGDQFTTTLD